MKIFFYVVLILYFSQNKNHFMQTINLDRIIKSKNLDKKELAQRLFPDNKYAALALNRVIKGDGFLDSKQISLLSELVNIPIGKLFTGAGWDLKSGRGLLIITSDDFRAELDRDTWVTKVFENGSLFHESIIHSRNVPLSAYLAELTKIVDHQNEK
tara:strand:- start:258 stop:725 length:468 start_codon:yes stop_codon:yes gene_type:complete